MITGTDSIFLSTQKVKHGLNLAYAGLGNSPKLEFQKPVEIDPGTGRYLAIRQCTFIKQPVGLIEQILSCHAPIVVTCYKKNKQPITMGTGDNLVSWQNSLIHGYIQRTKRSAPTFSPYLRCGR
jgi:hypothetical protein